MRISIFQQYRLGNSCTAHISINVSLNSIWLQQELCSWEGKIMVKILPFESLNHLEMQAQGNEWDMLILPWKKHLCQCLVAAKILWREHDILKQCSDVPPAPKVTEVFFFITLNIDEGHGDRRGRAWHYTSVSMFSFQPLLKHFLLDTMFCLSLETFHGF